MNRKTRLQKRLAKLIAKRDSMKARALASTDVNEVRSINEQLTDINDEIEDINDEIKEIEEEERTKAAEGETRQLPPTNAQHVNAGVLASFSAPIDQTQKRANENPYETMEYRMAFKAYVQNGDAIPAKLIDSIAEYRASLPEEQRAGVPVTTADTAPAIPLTVMREVINTVRKRYGNLYAKVRKMSVPGGVEIPIGALQAKFKWINESTVSPRQKLAPLGKIQFSYHTAEIRIAQSFLSNLLTIEEFENKIVEVIAIAYVQAMDDGIVNGTGQGQMLGILNDPRVAATGNVVTMTAAQISSWTEWRKRFFSKLPLGYRAGEFIFPLSTVESYLETMADANNNPVFRQATGLVVNDADAVNPNGSFFGRDISLVEPDILTDFDTASADDVIGIYWQPQEYGINENFGFTMRRYFDEESNEWVDKAITVVDGKVLNPAGIWLIKKA